MALYEKFGEFDSAEEINTAVQAQKDEGDEEAVLEIAKENGIDEEDARDFLAGDIPELCTALSAAVGKLELEKKDLGCKELMADWAEYLIGGCAENPELALAVRRKGKSLAGALGAVLKYSWGAKGKVDGRITKAAGIGNARVEFGVPGMGTARRLCMEYYLGSGKEAEK